MVWWCLTVATNLTTFYFLHLYVVNLLLVFHWPSLSLDTSWTAVGQDIFDPEVGETVEEKNDVPRSSQVSLVPVTFF